MEMDIVRQRKGTILDAVMSIVTVNTVLEILQGCRVVYVL